MAYDVFISYRRDGGFETARHLFDLLTHDGYTVSFDLDSLREGPFDSALLERIDACNDFILVVNKTAFVRTLDPEFDPQNDWLRAELAYALKKGKNVIPVLLAGATIPANLPEDLESLPNLNRPSYSIEYFDSFYEKLKDFLHSKPSVQIANDECGEIHIETDVECNVFCFKKWVLRAAPSEDNVLHLKPGKYRISVVSEEFPDLEENFAIDIPTSGYIDYISINFLLQINGRVHLTASEKDGKWGFVSEDGKVRIPFKYDDATGFVVELCTARIGAKWGFIYKAGNTVIPFVYDDAKPYLREPVPVKKNGKWGYIDSTGTTVIPFLYDDGENFIDKLAPVRIHKQWGVIDSNGLTVIPHIYEEIQIVQSSDIIPVKTSGKWGFIDMKGNEVIRPVYDFCSTAYHDLFLVRIGGNFGYVNYKGLMVIPTIYEDIAHSSHPGPIELKLDGKWGYVDSMGNTLIPFIYDEVGGWIPHGIANVKKGNKWGFVNTEGKEVIPFIYDKASTFYGRGDMLKAQVEKDGESFYIDRNGNRL